MNDTPSLTNREALTKYGALKKHSGVFLGLLGAAAGAVSAVLPEEFQSTLEPLGRALFLDGFIIHPALLFSPVIAYGVWAFGDLAGRKKWIGAGLAFLTALAGWVLAVKVAVFLYDVEVGAGSLPGKFLIPGFASGAVGSALVFFGGAISVARLRAVCAWGPVVLIGGVLGMVLISPAMESGNDFWGPLSLLAIWQGCVAAWFGRCLTGKW